MGYITNFTGKVLAKDGITDVTLQFMDFVTQMKEAAAFATKSHDFFTQDALTKLEDFKVKLAGENMSNILIMVQDVVQDGVEAKWYSYHKNMIQFSAAFPDFIFEIKGVGEEHKDQWINWYCNGKSVGGQAQVVFPTLDLDALLNEKP